MKIFYDLIKKGTRKSPETLSDKQRKSLVKSGREQFKQLVDKGLRIPVALL